MADVDKATVRSILRRIVDQRDNRATSAQATAKQIAKAIGLEFDADTFDEERFLAQVQGFCRDVSEYRIFRDEARELEEKLLD